MDEASQEVPAMEMAEAFAHADDPAGSADMPEPLALSALTDLAEANTVESRLAAVWVRSLGPKGRDLQRHILHVTFGLKRISRLLRDAEATLGVRIPATALLQLGTVKAVAAAIELGNWPAVSPMVLLHDGSPEHVLLIPSPGSGVVLELCDLAALIDFPGQIWALQLPGLDGEAPPLTSIEAIAACYVDAVRASHPAATCHVLGYSFGGLVAIEMVHIMARQGLRVGLVGLLDTGCDEKFWPRGAWLRFAVQQTLRRLAEMRKMPRGKAIRYVAGKGPALLRHVGRRINNQHSNNIADVTRSINYIGGYDPDFQRVRDASLIAYETYRPRRVEANGVLFRSALGEPHSCDPEHLWRPLFRHLQVVGVPGSHTTMVRKPLAATLAREISDHLARAMSGDSIACGTVCSTPVECSRPAT